MAHNGAAEAAAEISAAEDPNSSKHGGVSRISCSYSTLL
ncbi:hypothetical protein A2U01_0055922 [Trifolium medium]|uniref:Uncharacterized protein n=1 Tax=Trifolium medium TaxID=97028 RepID=A0A392REZ2_9FABA|nr:hypothetical protein [Trifolium medium]